MENNHDGAEPTGVDSTPLLDPEIADLQAVSDEVSEVETVASTEADDITDVEGVQSDTESTTRPRRTGWKEFATIEDGERQGEFPWFLT